VLLADDNADMREYVSRLLRARYRVEAVGDGEAALRAARREPPDLILADVMMPLLDGFDLLRSVRYDPELSEIPVILLSARAGEEARIDGVRAGAADYLTKPFTARELVARVDSQVRRKRARAEQRATSRPRALPRRARRRVAQPRRARRDRLRGDAAARRAPRRESRVLRRDERRRRVVRGRARRARGGHRTAGRTLRDRELRPGVHRTAARGPPRGDRGHRARALGSATHTARPTARSTSCRGVGIPLVRNGRWLALLAVQHRTARDWTSSEVALIEETAERTFAAIERARAEQTLRVSEERYRTLFESIDEAFCICEILLDEDGRPDDYRFLEVNPAFVAMTDLESPIGHTVRELVPDLQEFWVETYGKVALTGESVRFERQALPTERWFDVYCARNRRARGSTRRDRLQQHHRAQAGRGRAARGRSPQGRVPRHALARAAQPARTGAERAVDPAELRQRARDVRPHDRDDGAAGGPDGPADRRPARREPDQPRQAGAAPRADPARTDRRAGLESCRPLLEAAGHDVRLALPREPIALDADPLRLSQVFGNLIHNACKFTVGPGRIAIRSVASATRRSSA
jgi:DNA-binding response OmpR family regulator